MKKILLISAFPDAKSGLRLITSGLFLLSAFFPLSASAALVQCTVSETGALCSFCQLLATIQSTFNFILGLVFLGAVILIAKAGLEMYFTAGDPGKVQAALKNILKVVVGIVIVITAWAVVNTILVFFARPGSPPTFWNNISC
ncbi:MAG: hypothetical protein UX26_C0001G0015 [Parcubacteria group bacterium GW2011_GWC1_45_9]|nr:MAG: hypothetical protein UW85_C0008G0008 [Parcubacteria group bacterium GW2011_GWA1_Parcubacteria_45_10]KKT88699.1 MAG: hypothetical protein UW89_C0005G0004 [Parcubacteria group bacterium GW2011_GWB1_45_10]KKU17445.1 MAG: hypothetical protein UX26_C0001G0015 [Parcubacteria group bacterium GW2011_GWC1_45_9]HCI05550.1 hypothetical protein [Patescibacteria group bacterium]